MPVCRYLFVLFLTAFILGMLIQASHSQEKHMGELKELVDQLVTFYQQGRYAEAIPIAEKLLSINEESIGPDHPEVAIILNKLAELYRLVGDYDRAKPMHKRALEINEKVFGPEHP